MSLILLLLLLFDHRSGCCLNVGCQMSYYTYYALSYALKHGPNDFVKKKKLLPANYHNIT